MAQDTLNNFFEDFLNREDLFLDRKALQSSHIPETTPHRKNEVKEVANILAPALKSERPSNLFVYGKTGTGKTMVLKHITKVMNNMSADKNIPLSAHYINCKLKKVADTEYRLIAQIIRKLGKDVPFTGLPTDEVYQSFFDLLEEEKKTFIFVLDEIDQLIKKTGDGILYNLTRINEELKHSQVCIVGISNDLMFINNIDPRVRSSLSEEELVFPPYNALQLQDILRQRAEIAFKKEALMPGVIEKCAAYAAREHGDARRAIELLRVAGEVAERNNESKVKITDIDAAEKKLENDRITELVTSQPKQIQATLYAIITSCLNRKENIFTGEVYEAYKQISTKIGLQPLTLRRVSDILSELDMLGIINIKLISKGRYGRTREISLPELADVTIKIKKILEDGLGLS